MALSLAVGHFFAAFNYASMKTYAQNFQAPAFSLLNFSIGMILFLGIMGSILAYMYQPKALENIFIDGVIVGNAALLPLLAVETRFSLISMAFLFLRAFQLPSLVKSREVGVLIGFGAVLFSFAFVLIGTLMFQIAGFSMNGTQ